MRVRDYLASDFDRVKDIYLQRKYEFELPDLDHPLILSRKVLVDSEDIVRLAAFARLQVNAYLLVDGKWETPKMRLESMEKLQGAMIDRCKFFGVDEASAQVEPRFARRLKGLHWRPAPGVTVARNL